jgi:endonuclease/exonuclease/phosphatase (EEP) superfamily protein YafD
VRRHQAGYWQAADTIALVHILSPESAGVVALAVAAIALVVRYVPVTNHVVLGVVALAPYLMLGAPVSLIVFALQRDWVLAAAAATVTIVTVAVQLPWCVRSAAAPGVSVRLMSANLRYGRADADAVVRMAREHADILAVQELTPEKADLMSAAGVDETFPFQALRACDAPAGVGIWSRYPISTSDTDEDFWLGLVTAKVRVPDVTAEATVVVTHLSAPWPDPIAGWRIDLHRMAEKLPQLAAAADGAVMVAGDFNATRDIREFRRLLRDGYRDAAEQAGAGLTRTHPADIWLPPVFALDHILTRGCAATAVRTLAIKDSDHRALVAAIQLPD